jgi:hypothetical protein
MSTIQHFISHCFFFCLLVIVPNLAIVAQTTIFNIPSTDVVTEKTAYLEADFLAHFDSTNRGGFQTYGYRVVYGARKNLEVGANFFISRNGSKTSPKEGVYERYKVFVRNLLLLLNYASCCPIFTSRWKTAYFESDKNSCI